VLERERVVVVRVQKKKRREMMKKEGTNIEKKRKAGSAMSMNCSCY